MAKQIKKMSEEERGMNDDIKFVYIEAILMPNGEIISEGKTIGWDNTTKKIFAEVIE